MKPLALPQVNLNGTSYTVLVEQQLAVMHALDALYAAMNEAAPNGRDYQLRPAEFAPARGGVARAHESGPRHAQGDRGACTGDTGQRKINVRPY